MHRIRLHSQWKRDTSIQEVSRFFRPFHAPTGLHEADSVFFTAALAEHHSLSEAAIIVRLNNVQLTPLLTPSEFRVDITPHLQKFNQLVLEFPQPSISDHLDSPLWPLENLALEIHSHTPSD